MIYQIVTTPCSILPLSCLLTLSSLLLLLDTARPLISWPATGSQTENLNGPMKTHKSNCSFGLGPQTVFS